MPTKDGRRHKRLPYSGPIRLTWEEPGVGQRFTLGKCLDVSESGLRIEVAVPVPVRAAAALRAERIHFSGTATVKHVDRYGAKYLLGLEFNSGLTPKALDAIREPWALRSGTLL